MVKKGYQTKDNTNGKFRLLDLMNGARNTDAGYSLSLFLIESSNVLFCILSKIFFVTSAAL